MSTTDLGILYESNTFYVIRLGLILKHLCSAATWGRKRHELGLFLASWVQWENCVWWFLWEIASWKRQSISLKTLNPYFSHATVACWLFTCSWHVQIDIYITYLWDGRCHVMNVIAIVGRDYNGSTNPQEKKIVHSVANMDYKDILYASGKVRFSA